MILKLLSCPHKNARPLETKTLLIKGGVIHRVSTIWYCPDCGCQWRDEPIFKESEKEK